MFFFFCLVFHEFGVPFSSCYTNHIQRCETWAKIGTLSKLCFPDKGSNFPVFPPLRPATKHTCFGLNGSVLFCSISCDFHSSKYYSLSKAFLCSSNRTECICVLIFVIYGVLPRLRFGAQIFAAPGLRAGQVFLSRK